MPITIPEAYVETFESIVRHLAQQKYSKLRDCVMEVNRQSESHNWDRLAASAARQKPNVRAQSPAGGSGSGAIDTTDGLTWSRRKTIITTWDWGEIVASEEALQMLIDPYSSVADNGAMAMKRAVDDIILTAATGPATIGDGTTVALPAGQILGNGTTSLSMDTLLAARRKFAENDIEPDEPLYLVISPNEQETLLGEEKVTSFDYQNQKMLSEGYIDNFLGFSKIIISNRLLDGIGVGSTSHFCLAFSPKAIGLHVAGDIRADAAPRPDMSFETQVYLQLDMDAVRVEDEHIVAMDVLKQNP
jgi:hypothetical protein